MTHMRVTGLILKSLSLLCLVPCVGNNNSLGVKCVWVYLLAKFSCLHVTANSSNIALLLCDQAEPQSGVLPTDTLNVSYLILLLQFFHIFN